MSHAPQLSSPVEAAVERVAVELRALIGLLQTEPTSALNVAAVESAGRLMDAARVHAASALASGPLAAEALGYSTPVAAVAALAQVSDRTARSRLLIAGAITPGASLCGASLLPARPRLAAALHDGQVGLDAAVLVARELDSVAARVPGETLFVAEDLMVTLATGCDSTGQHKLAPVSVDYLTTEIRQVSAAIDPDGARPREERAARRRGFRIGKQDQDGLFPASGGLMPEVALLLLAMLEADRRSPRFVDANSSEGELDGARALAGADTRTPDQRRHDTFAQMVMAAAAAKDAPQLDGAPVTVIVVAQQEELDRPQARDGDPVGVMVGSSAPVSRSRLRGFMDAGGFRVATKDSNGRVVSLSTPQRCFTNAQRLSIGARDGYRCARPWCTSAHYALQVHHVVPDRDRGPTHVDNGILLCYNCHRQVDTGPWQYRMVMGVPEVRGPGIPEWRRLRPATARAA